MKIIMPVDDKSMSSTVAAHFGRADYFLIYDTETKESQFISNPAATSQGGAGIKAAQTVLDTGADALITPRLGNNAGEVLQDGKISMFQAEGTSIEENLNLCSAGKLAPITSFQKGLHNHG